MGERVILVGVFVWVMAMVWLAMLVLVIRIFIVWLLVFRLGVVFRVIILLLRLFNGLVDNYGVFFVIC